MRILSPIVMLPCAAALLIFATGCPSNSSSDDGGSDDGQATTDGGGEHGHSHDVPGPAGGHLLEIGDEEYHVEWVHDEEDEGVIEFIIRDEMAKEEVPIDAEKLVIEFTIVNDNGEEITREVDVPALGRGEDEDTPKTARFELTDRIAIGNILGGDKDVTAVLKVTIAGVAYEREIEHAGGHGHSHSH